MRPDPTLERPDAHAKLAANQKTKEKVGAEINTAIDVFKKTHEVARSGRATDAARSRERGD